VTELMIPEEAVQAGAKALFIDDISNGSGSSVPEIAAVCEDVVRKVLKAAAPHMHRVVMSAEGLLPGAVVQDKTGDVLKLMDNGEWWATDTELDSFIEFPARVLVEGGGKG
jgi:hypothetical protein